MPFLTPARRAALLLLGLRNLWPNPSFEVNTNYTRAAGGTTTIARDTSNGRYGIAALRADVDSATSGSGWASADDSGASRTAVETIAIKAGRPYSVSLDAKVSVAATVRLSLIWSDSSGTFVRQDDIDFALTTAYQRIAVSVTAPPNAVWLQPRFRKFGTGTSLSHYTDGFQIQQRPVATSFRG